MPNRWGSELQVAFLHKLFRKVHPRFFDIRATLFCKVEQKRYVQAWTPATTVQVGAFRIFHVCDCCVISAGGFCSSLICLGETSIIPSWIHVVYEGKRGVGDEEGVKEEKHWPIDQISSSLQCMILYIWVQQTKPPPHSYYSREL